MASPSTPGSDEADRPVNAGRDSHFTWAPPGSLRRSVPQPAVDYTAAHLERGRPRTRKWSPKDEKGVARERERGPGPDLRPTIILRTSQPIEKAQEQPMKIEAVRRPKVDVGDFLVVTHDFLARSSDELTLAQGDQIEVIEKDDEFADGWFLGKNLLNGNCGLFPEAYVMVKISKALGASNDRPTVQKGPEAQGVNPETVPRPDTVEKNVADNPPSPVCSSSGAILWDREKYRSTPYHGNQDGLSDQEIVDRKYLKKGKTRIPAHLTSKWALIDLGYPFVEEGNTIVLLKALDQQLVDDVLRLSADYQQRDLEMDAARPPSQHQADGDHNDSVPDLKTPSRESDRIDELPFSPSNRPPDSPPRPRSDDGGDGAVQICDDKSDGDDNGGYDSDEVHSEHEVAVIEDHTPPGSVYAESPPGSRTSGDDTVSNALYSAVFSENSRQQPTDPSSGFNSDRAGARGYPDDIAMHNLTEDNLVAAGEAEDCSRSISSVADSIGSAFSTGGSLGQPGVNYVVAKFTQSDPELLALYTEASQRLTKDRFVDNNRRLLKMFYLDFACDEQTPSQKQASAFLRSRRRRAEISLDILRTVTPDNEIIHAAEKDRKEFSMLNEYFETLDAADTSKNVEQDQVKIESDGSEVEDATDPPLLDMNSLQAIGEYFVTSRAFSQYKQRLDQFLHPEHQEEHKSTGGQGLGSKSKEDRGDESRTVEPGDKPIIATVTEHPLDDHIEETRSQAERHPAEQEDETRNESRSENISQTLSYSPQTANQRMSWKRDSLITWATKLMTDILWPPSKGSRRIWYLCGCGEHSYMDVKELEHGGIETEWRSISESSAAIRRARAPSSSTSSGRHFPAAPPPAHLGPVSSGNTAPPNSSTQKTPHTPRAYLNPASAIPPMPAVNTPRDPLFLMICINGKAYKTLAELRCLGVDDSYNDELLVRGILDLYEQTRKGSQWTIGRLFPTWVLPASLIQYLNNIWKDVPASVRRPSFIRDLGLAQSISEWWSRCAPNVSPWAPLHIIDTADFVEFELVPHPEGKEAFPSHFTSGRWPESDNKQYRYRPVPMKCVKTMNLWHMRRPGPHTEVYWYNTVPKKVDGPLYRPSGTVEDVVGYGVRINERLNDVLVLWWSFIFILATGVFVFVYSYCTGDNSSAFGLGAYLVAAFTVYIQLQYAWWKRT